MSADLPAVVPPTIDASTGERVLGALPMRSSPAIDQLTLSLAKAQGQFPAIEKDKTARIQTTKGAAYSYNYADLATILAAVRKPLSENALAIMQPVHMNGRSVTVTTVVAHGSGQWVADALDMPIGDPTDARSLASAVTYARRYGLIALLGIAPADEDDDAEAATPPAPAPKTAAPPAAVSFGSTTGVVDGARGGMGEYATVEAPPPARTDAAPVPEGYVTVLRIDSTPTKNDKVTKYFVTLSNGVRATTINQWLATLAQECCEAQTPVRAVTQETRWGPELKSLKADPPDPPPSLPLTADEIPF